jgi:hypothetical protein
MLAVDAKAELAVIVLQFGYDMERRECSSHFLEYLFAGQCHAHPDLQKNSFMVRVKSWASSQVLSMNIRRLATIIAESGWIWLSSQGSDSNLRIKRLSPAPAL